MALTILSTGNVLDRGTVANDNTGDTLRTAAQKINTNFEIKTMGVGNIVFASLVVCIVLGVVAVIQSRL